MSDVVLASAQLELFVGECLCSSLKIKKIVRSDEKRREDGQTNHANKAIVMQWQIATTTKKTQHMTCTAAQTVDMDSGMYLKYPHRWQSATSRFAAAARRQRASARA